MSDAAFELWWNSLDDYPHDKSLKRFPIGNHGDGLAVSKIGMKSLWDSMVPFWDSRQELTK